MADIYGDLIEDTAIVEFLTCIRLVDGPLGLTWQHSSTTSEFLGDFFALRAAAAGLDYNEVRHSIVYLINELLENALKFRAVGDIEIRGALAGERFQLVVSNFLTAQAVERFSALLAELTAGDPGDLLIEGIEANAADSSSSASGLGILTLMNDYGAKLGWKFDQQENDGTARLRTFAALDLA
jgi:hypothetical protein